MDISIILKEFFSSYIVAWIMLLAFIVSATWVICRKYSALKQKVDSVDKLPCREHQQLINASTNDLREIKGMLSILTESVDFPFSKINRRAERVYSRKRSPRALNEAGQSLYQRSGGKAFIELNLQELIQIIDNLNPLTALDVESDAVIALRQLATTSKMNAVKDWVYNAPVETISDETGNEIEHEVTLGDVLFVCSIPLRDYYLSQRPQIKPKES